MTDQRVRTSGTILWYSGTARPVLDFSASHPLAPRHNMLSAHSTRVRPRKTETATCPRALHLIAVHILAHPAERDWECDDKTRHRAFGDLEPTRGSD